MDSIRIIEPFGAGGGPDVVARVVATNLSALWDEPVTVENHPGDGSTRAPSLVARSAADGRTLLVNTSAHAYSAALAENLPYDPLNDFIPVASLTSQPYVLIASAASGIRSLRELIATARARPGELTFGSTGVGTGSHIGSEKLALAAGFKARHVPAGPADSISEVIADLVAGRITYVIAPIPTVLGDIHLNKVRPLGVTTAKRSPLLPDVPTIAENGVPGFDHPIWYGVWVTAGTREEIVERIGAGIAHALSAPDVVDRLADHGAEPMRMTREGFARFVRSEADAAARIMKAGGVEGRQA